MNRLIILLGAVVLSSPVLALDGNEKQPSRDMLLYQVPPWQRGSGQQAGGPANELNPGVPFAVYPPAPAYVYDPEVVGSIVAPPPPPYWGAPIPEYQRGSGQRAGGPANELIPW